MEDPMALTVLVSILTGGIGLEIVKMVIKRWQEASGRKARYRERYARTREVMFRARAEAIKRGASEDDLGAIPPE